MNISRKSRLTRTSVMAAMSFSFLMSLGAIPRTWAQVQGDSEPAEVLTLQAYLNSIRTGNKEYLGSVKAKDGVDLRSMEWKLLTRPTLIGTTQFLNDQSETGSPLTGDETRTQGSSVGVQQQTDFGLRGVLTYHYNITSLPGANPTLIPERDFYTSGVVLELSQSLWRNGAGRETRAAQQVLSAQAMALSFTEGFRQIQILADAEAAYWRLALAREAVEASREILERARRLDEWNDRRTRLELADRSDRLQSSAVVLARTYELETARDEEKEAARAFNTLRGVDADRVTEKLSSFEPDVVDRLAVPERVRFRDDVKAAEEQMRASLANAQSGVEKNKPIFDVFGTVGLNGRDARSGEAFAEGFSLSRPNYAVGIRLEIPLDFDTLDRNRQGYRTEAMAAELAFQYRMFRHERLWDDLVSRFHEAQKRLKLSRQIEEAQREKLDYERTRHRRGRTTTYQVIQFEQDLANAQLAKIRAQADVLGVHAQLKTFEPLCQTCQPH